MHYRFPFCSKYVKYICSGLFGAFAPPVFADLSDDIFEYSLSELLKVKVTSAARADQSILQAPASMTVFTRQDIESFGIHTLEQLLNYVAGAQYHREGLESQVTFRGRRSLGSDVLVLLDGIRLNDPVSASAFLAFQNLSLTNIEKVEVIKGPGSALYGSNAYNGVISLTSRQQIDELNIAVGSNDRQLASMAYGKAGKEWTINFNVERYHDDGQYYPAFFDFFGNVESTYDPKSGSHVYLSGGFYGLHAKLGRFNRLSEDFVWSSQGNGINQFDIESDVIQLAYQFDGIEPFSGTMAYERVDSTQSIVLVQLPANIAQGFWTNGADEPFIGGNYREVISSRVVFDGMWQDSQFNQWQFGAEYRQEESEEITFQGNWDPVTNRESNGFIFLPRSGPYTRELWWFGNYQPLVPQTSREVTTAYIQHIRKLSPSWQVTLGAHYDDYNDVGDNLSIRGAVVYQQQADTTFKILYGQAFKAPTLIELNALIATGQIGNPELEPETVETIDLIWLQDWRGFQSSLTFYQSRFNNVIESVFVEDILDGFVSFQPQNLGNLDLSGWELELNGKINEQFDFRLSFAHAIEHVVLAAAQDTGSIMLNYKLDKFSFNINSVYRSDVLSREMQAENIYLDSFWLTNVVARYQLTDELNLSFTVKNFLDEEYNVYSVINGLENGSPNRGREWQLLLNWQL